MLYCDLTIVKASLDRVKLTISSPILAHPLAGYSLLPTPLGVSVIEVVVSIMSDESNPLDLRGAFALSLLASFSVSLPLILAPDSL